MHGRGEEDKQAEVTDHSSFKALILELFGRAAGRMVASHQEQM